MDNKIYKPISVAHPGEIVIDYLEAHGWSQRDLSRRTGLTPKTISEICNGKAPISPTTSLAFERVFGRPAHFWMNLQSRFDEARVRSSEAKYSAQWNDWLREFPLSEMRRRGWVPQKGETTKSDVSSLLEFFGVSSPDGWSSVWQDSRVSYRQTRNFKTNDYAISAWVRATEIAVDEIDLNKFDEFQFRTSIPEIRKATRQPIDQALEAMQMLAAESGVAIVLVPALPHTGISGCARWLDDGKAMVALTLRYKMDDQIWFTLFHEIGHILLHRKKNGFILDNADENLTDPIVDPDMRKFEDEANRFAADTLIPPIELKRFMASNIFTNESIHDFADAIDLAPGIVVGRLQHEGILKFSQGNALKQIAEWSFKPN